ncbi:unnamed protein product [Ixodes persulcatus]
MAEAKLTGFSSFLDWKLLTFQRSLPRACICDLCGLVSQTSMVAVCLHAFCLDCYQRLLVEASPKCPLDAIEISPDESMQFVLGDAQRDKLTVSCLNAPHGCDFRGPLFDLENHFVKNCSFHTVSCKGCGGPVLRNNILEHLNACRLQDRGTVCVGAQSGISEEKVKFDYDNGAEINALAANAVMCTGHDSVNVLVESMRKCSQSVNDLENLARNLVESVKHCVTVTDDSTNKTSSFIESFKNCTKVVKDIQALCENLPTNWVAAGFRPGHLGKAKLEFVFTNFSAKRTQTPAGFKAPQYYPACSKGEVTIDGYQVKLSQIFQTDHCYKMYVSFKLEFVGQAITSGLSIDMTLVLIHPTDASLNKTRPLLSHELFETSNPLKEFSFEATSLYAQGFVLDDMICLCLEVVK